MKKPKIALTIAGTDPTGGAGIMADLKSFQASGVYGMAVPTSIVSQNTLGVQAVHHLTVDVIESQLKSVFDDEQPHAIKTGMIASEGMMNAIKPYIEASNKPYVIDPVMVAKSGDALMDEQGKNKLKEILLSLATVVTPNIPEAEEIVGFKIQTEEEIKKAGAFFLNEIGSKGVVIKGGHLEGDAIDYLFTNEGIKHWTSERFNTKHTHGTGCTFSAVITAELAKGHTIEEAVHTAKRFITLAIQHTPEIGKGQGPVNHFAYQKIEGLDYE
ncbi:bifunctional hydroxymethylpyrimidine kinase/phosphomethylpyrimidine kinase [Mammaliicoccus sp. Dog046]|uniref:bifunctional hydroxymethylpyrimidine kinase/phosphomethylpyrimidine kinase n=1 Tax=Mammaliicoccus sp. Dog046 TaxID=3034233 RepID=UPI002B258C2C|nr:bifunctional hydroxymethylpyrimidine kinase/phosphomethylpyrimidine kinase [Mammaliicoccus sp. Dog046]WQK86118.1 bifunctional hydroxymethylpyrimidine kinase/phosphomethylpyrimidine kinase [Mammaliicoccus sp. Dog046]